MEENLVENTTKLTEWINSSFTFGNNIINKKKQNIEIKTKLLEIFGNDEWFQISPRGNGFCTLNAVVIYNELKDKNLIDFNHLNIKSSKQIIINNLIQGSKKYFRERYTGKGENSIIIRLTDNDIEYIDKNTSDNKIRNILNKIENLDNTPTELLRFMKSFYKINIILLTYDYKSSQPILQIDKLKYNNDWGTTCIILTYDGHSRLFFTKSKDLIKKAVSNLTTEKKRIIKQHLRHVIPGPKRIRPDIDGISERRRHPRPSKHPVGFSHWNSFDGQWEKIKSETRKNKHKRPPKHPDGFSQWNSIDGQWESIKSKTRKQKQIDDDYKIVKKLQEEDDYILANELQDKAIRSRENSLLFHKWIRENRSLVGANKTVKNKIKQPKINIYK